LVPKAALRVGPEESGMGEGTPEEITQMEESYTGKYLKEVL
jgi:excinuclease UvrABC ATPase subunit